MTCCAQAVPAALPVRAEKTTLRRKERTVRMGGRRRAWSSLSGSISGAPFLGKPGVDERHEDRAGWCRHAAFGRRRDALVFLDTAVTPGGESMAADSAPKERETPERSAEPDQSARGGRRGRSRTTSTRPAPRGTSAGRCAACSSTDEKQPPAGRRAGELPEVPAVPVGGQLPETPGSDEGGEEGDLTGRRPDVSGAVGCGAESFTGPERGGTLVPGPAPAQRNGSSV